jgi:dynein heavy chain 2
MRQVVEQSGGGAPGAAHGSAAAASCCPVLFVLSPGADPSRELAACAEAALAPSGNRLREVAMGQGQAEVALGLLRECARSGAGVLLCAPRPVGKRDAHGDTAVRHPTPPAAGDWLLLKNLHLATAWLPRLEKEVHGLLAGAAAAERHARFRVFLTSQPHPAFPATLLEGCLKVCAPCARRTPGPVV